MYVYIYIHFQDKTTSVRKAIFQILLSLKKFFFYLYSYLHVHGIYLATLQNHNEKPIQWKLNYLLTIALTV